MSTNYRDGYKGMIKWCNDKVRIPIYPLGSDIAEWTLLNDLSDELHPVTGKSYKGIWYNQQKILKEALVMSNKRFKYRLIVFCWMRGEGKCQEKGSKVLLFDGTVKKVEDVIVGDLLMGDDNTPREVLSLASGREEMFEVTPMRGEPMVVTGDHMLTLKRRRNQLNKRGKPFNDPHAGKIFDMSVNDFQKQNKAFKDLNLLYRVPIDWPEQEVTIDPYFLGMWLGDGHSHIPSITTMDQEVVDYLYKFAKRMDLLVSIKSKKDNKASTYNLIGKKHGKNLLLNKLRELGVDNNKYIPQVYKINSREVRLQVLSGLLDSDGYRNRNSIQFTLKSKLLSDDIVFLARSLGFHSEIKKCIKTIKSINFSGEYYRVGIFGDCSIVPTLLSRKKCPVRSDWKDVLVTGIRSIAPVGEREYYGFTLSGNGRYVTGDFTVTHNSLLACLVQMWKFFNWTKQLIVCGANSKDQVKFVHYDIIRDIILNSPKLLEDIGGKKNIREKEIRRISPEGNIDSTIRSISSFSGIVSNITGYTFSEIFDMKNPKFFTQLDGSIRNIPNALGVIDSTVSAKVHVLHELYKGYITGATKEVYFSYRCSKFAKQEDYWNPNMDDAQLSDYRAKFPFGEFEKYFQNLWESGVYKVFNDALVEEVGMIGYDGIFLNHLKILEANRRLEHYEKDLAFKRSKGVSEGKEIVEDKINKIENKKMKVDEYYSLIDGYGLPQCITLDDLNLLGDLFNTDWVILAGLDFADPYAARTNARTMMVFIAKGMVDSRGKAYVIGDAENTRYIYFVIHIESVAQDSLDTVKERVEELHDEYKGIDSLCSERYGAWDLANWCQDRGIKFEPVYPSYDRQKMGFKEFYNSVREGRFKAPTIAVPGSKSEDILREEMKMFDHKEGVGRNRGWFGSPEKQEKGGVQDDLIFAICWGMFGGMNLNVDDFYSRKSTGNFGVMFQDKQLYGTY